MLITALAEDTSCFQDYRPDKGLSLFIRTAKHNILFDFGYRGAFLDNARQMGIDIREVDIAVLSHSHDDHCNGIADFLAANEKAKVYLQRSAFDGIYESIDTPTPAYVGVDPALRDHPRLVPVDGSMVIDDELALFSGVKPVGITAGMFRREGDALIPDDFRHEQYLVIREGGKRTLITGCSHCGIVNILGRATEAYGGVDVLLGGYHMIAYDLDKAADRKTVANIGRDLLRHGAMCYTCHCTGTRGYQLLKTVMGDRLGYLSTGMTLHI